MNEIIKVTQLPIIEEKLKILSDEIDSKVQFALNLVCTEETVKEVKKVRTELNKQFNELEEQRKAVKNAIMQPYSDFENIYNSFISNKFKIADKGLKEKINEVENELKFNKEKEVKEYFEEYLQSVNINWVTWDMIDLNITLSTSLKKLKEQTKAFIDRVVSDLSVIEVQEDKEEILVEYQKTRNLSQSIQVVKDRKERLRILKETEEQRKKEQELREQRAEEVIKVVELTAPKVEVEEEFYNVTFSIKETKEKIKLLVDFMRANNIEFEQK